MIHIYLDAEFDAVRIQKKFQQAIISLGAVMLDQEGTIIDEFYSLVKPMAFKRLSHVVYKMTHLQNEEIQQANELPIVMAQFLRWIHTYEEDMDKVSFYSFGPDDRRTLIQNCHYYDLDGEFFSRMKDLQKELSPKVKFQDQIISPTLSLDDLKSVYAIQGAVDHNALSDARDLMEVHCAYCLGKQQDSTQIVAIVNRKIAKQQEVAKKQRQRLARVMKERFEAYPKRLKILCYPEVIDQFRMIKERDHTFSLRFKEDHMVMDGDSYYYNDMKMVLELKLEDENPYVLLDISYHGRQLQKQFLLTYRNATMIEDIIKRMNDKIGS